MSAFDPVPTYRTSLPGENANLALDMPLSPMRSLWEQTSQGVLNTFGTGGVVKDFSTPRGVPTSPNMIEQGAAGIPLVGSVVQGYEAARSIFGAQTTGKPITQEDWKGSPYFRKEIPWDAAMTTDRAEALAAQYDLRKAREYFGSKDMVSTIVGGLAGGFLDPINFVPVFGPAARTAAAAKFGFVAGHALIGASEAAINTAVFGALTAPDRARYGEDVSWESAINNIAFSAVAGGVLGGVGGALEGVRSRRAMKAEQSLRVSTETIRNLQDSRGVLNDAVASIMESGDVRLSPASKGVLERISADVTDKRLASRALDIETRDVQGSKAGEVVISPSGARVAVRPEVVDLATLKPATGALQVRNRSGDNLASVTQIEDIATKLDPDRLMPNIDASQGAPLVGDDNVVDSGNGRVAGIKRAYEAYPDKAAAYRKALADAGYNVEGMSQPVLISRRLTPLSDEARAQFNADVNGQTTARMSAVELAAMDRGALTQGALDTLRDGEITSAGNRNFVRNFLGNLPLNERLGLVDPNGNFSADGVRRIQNALMAAAYGDVDAVALRKFAEATDDNTRSIVGALSDVAPRWLSMRRAVQRGDVSAEFDQTPELMEALRRLSGWRDQAAREGRPVSTVITEGLAQGDMLSGSIPLPVKLFARLFYTSDEFTQAAGRDAIAGRLADLADVSVELGRPDMLGEAYAATKLGVLSRVYSDVETDILTPEGFRTLAAEVGDAGGGPGLAGNSGRDQPRVGANAGYRNPVSPAEVVATVTDLKRSQPARTIDELYAVAPQHQASLGEIGQALDGPGIKWIDPGLKDKAGAAEKLARKGYESTAELTDVVRGGFVVETPQNADSAIAALARRFKSVIDEGWQITAAGYFDRKVLVQFDDGTIGEVQFWHPDMHSTKEGAGHAIYKEMRGLAPDDPKFEALIQQQKDLYLSAVDKASDDWLPVISRLVSDLEAGGRPAHGNASSKAASSNGTPESTISAGSDTGRQSARDMGLNQEDAPLITAGLDSQSKNLSMAGDLTARAVDMQEARPYSPPDGLAEAGARVGKGEDLKALAEQFGVDPKTGDFAESFDIDELRAQGLVTPEDELELAMADQVYSDAETYAETLRVAAACVMG